MNIYLVSKEFTFDAAHRLVKGYDGKCKNVHGHTYKVVITVKATFDLDRYDFVLDFSELKRLKEWVDENWDHAMLVNNEDASMIAFLQENKQRYYGFRGNPTAEVIAEFLYDMSRTLITPTGISNLMIDSVRVYETPTSYAEYRHVD